MVKTVQISRSNIFEPTGTVAQLLERQGGCHFDPRPSNTKDFKNGITCSCSFVCAQHSESGTGRSGVSIM